MYMYMYFACAAALLLAPRRLWIMAPCVDHDAFNAHASTSQAPHTQRARVLFTLSIHN